jgi:hypothetical protein
LGTAAEDSPNVVIAWDKASDSDQVVSYEVRVLNNDGNFAAVADCDTSQTQDMENPRCTIPMTVFWAGDFQVDQGSYIAAVVRAVNSKGPGEFSRWNVDGAFVEKVPSMMNPPQGIRDESNNNVKLSWNEMTSPRNGGSEIETYVL